MSRGSAPYVRRRRPNPIQTLERLGADDVQVELHTATAEPGDAIVAIAEQVGADLGNKGMHRRVLGTIPNTVSHRATCDVLIVQTG